MRISRPLNSRFQVQSLTFRWFDSLPTVVVDRWKAELDAAECSQEWRDAEFRRQLEFYLDAGHGSCWLRKMEVAAMVQDALLHFDGQRYRFLAWCFMPNHVHVLWETIEGHPFSEVVHSIKSFTSKQANRILVRTGRFWQRDYFDRYIRDAEHFASCVEYIEANPTKAGLVAMNHQWRWSSAFLRMALRERLPPGAPASCRPGHRSR